MVRRKCPLLLLIVMLAMGCGRATDYPNRPLVLICPWAAGGGTDRISRQIAAQLEQELGVPVNVINATGGAGVTGHTRGATAKADGYTLTMITPELNMLHWRGLTDITHADFVPLMMVNRDAAALFVRADAPCKTLGALTEDIREHPKKYKASGTAFGGIWHLSLAGWLTQANIDPATVTWVSINGSNPSLQELLAGGVHMVCCSVPEAQSLLDSNKIRCLGVMVKDKPPGMEQLPTFHEQGIAWQHLGWRGLAVPCDVPDARREKLFRAIERVVESKTYRQYLKDANFGYAAEPKETFVAFLKKDDAYYGTMLRNPAFQAVQQVAIGPFVFPSLLGGLLAVTVVVVIVGRGRGGEMQAWSATGWGRMVLVVGLLVLFVLVLDGWGFLISGVLFLALLLLLLGVRWHVALVLPLILVPVVYQLFAGYLRVPLPWGLLGW